MPQTPPAPRRARRCRSHQSLLHRSSGQATAARSRMSSEVRLSPAATRPVPMSARRSQLTRAPWKLASAKNGVAVVAPGAAVASVTGAPGATASAGEPAGGAGEVAAAKGAGVKEEPVALENAGAPGA